MISACLIGEDSLLIQCGDILLNRSHRIEFVISSIKKIQDWAKKNQIPHFPTLHDLNKLNDYTSVDYIFSIANSHVLPNSLIKQARHAAINYHDSPLPRYAGLNATTWAILNGEKIHGVTWHLMTNKIDEGAIVKQSFFPIQENDTAFTLNLRCYEFAIASFQALIKDIEKNKLSFKNQNLQDTSYYSADYPLPNYGFIDWQTFPAEKIERMARALSFGHYKNGLGTLKIYFPNQYVIVSSLEICSKPLEFTKSPGTVLLIEKETIYISTLTRPIKVTSLLLPSGISLTIDEFIKKYAITIDFNFESLKNSDLRSLEKYYSRSIKYEDKSWVPSLMKISQQFIFSRKHITTTSNIQTLESKINIKNIFPNKKFYSIKNILTTAIFIYLYRLNNHENTSIFLVSPNFKEFHKKIANLFNYLLPINFNIPPYLSLDNTLKIIDNHINDIKKRKVYLNDIMIRHPLFENKTIEPYVVISFDDQFKPEFLPPESILYFQINEEKGEITIYHRFDIIPKSLINEMISNLTEHITNILIHLVNNPHLSITNFSFLPQHEKYKLLYIFGMGTEKYLSPLTLVELFKNQALQTPKQIAIYFEDTAISYEELWQYSEKIKNFILEHPLPAQRLIGIYLERSIEVIATIFGIFKAGAAYVPLDTHYPLSRVMTIIDDANITLIVTQHHLSEKLSKSFDKGGYPISFISIENILKNESISTLSTKSHPENLAYVMYTSGTTGKPKGVMVTQDKVLNYCHWFIQSTQFNQTSVMDFSSSISFDLSIPCSIAPLLTGGTIAICSERKKTNPKEYLLHLKKYGVTHVEMTPGYMHLLLNYPKKIQSLTHLKWLLLGADTVSKSDVTRWILLCPDHQLINEYGPTETTVAITSYSIHLSQLPSESSVPIGKPAFNTRCYVLDKYHNLCPIGIYGELWVSGAQVSQGYLNKPVLTENRFLFSNINTQNERIYKTGDVVYWLPDGNLQFLGRNDHQVKIGGYRVETAEIETILNKISGINQAIVIPQEEKFKNKYLRAYIVSEIPLTHHDELVNTLKLYLPTYMIPKEFCLVDSIPLKENEKIDYHALIKQPYRLLTDSSKTSIINTNFQEIILKLWRNTFNDSSINIHDNFFDLGGDSLTALRIIDEIDRHYNIEMPLVNLFDCPTVALLANKVYKFFREKQSFQSKDAHLNTVILLSKNTGETPLFLVHPIGGTIFWYKSLAALQAGQYSIFGIQDPNIDYHKITFNTLEDMAEYYLKVIKKIYPGKIYYLGGASFGATVAFEMANQLTQANKKVEFLGLLDGWAHYPQSLVQKSSSNLLNHKDSQLLRLSAGKKEKLFQLEQQRQQLLLNYSMPRIHLDATLFKATELWPEFQSVEDKYNGWREFITGQIEVYKVPGNHETMFFHPHVQTLANLLNQKLLVLATKGSSVPASLV
jgi:amino acid adenylation domain-containing protein